MKNKTILFLSLLIASGSAMAQQSVLDAAGQTLDSAKNLNESVKNAPAAAKEQARESVKNAAAQKLEQARPEEVKQGAEAVKSAKKLKGKVDAAPKSTGEAVNAVERKAKRKAAEKALDLLQ